VKTKEKSKDFVSHQSMFLANLILSFFGISQLHPPFFYHGLQQSGKLMRGIPKILKRGSGSGKSKGGIEGSDKVFVEFPVREPCLSPLWAGQGFTRVYVSSLFFPWPG